MAKTILPKNNTKYIWMLGYKRYDQTRSLKVIRSRWYFCWCHRPVNTPCLPLWICEGKKMEIERSRWSRSLQEILSWSLADYKSLPAQGQEHINRLRQNAIHSPQRLLCNHQDKCSTLQKDNIWISSQWTCPCKVEVKTPFTPTTKIIGDSNTSDSHCGNSEHMPYNLNLSIFQQFPMDRTKEFSI